MIFTRQIPEMPDNLRKLLAETEQERAKLRASTTEMSCEEPESVVKTKAVPSGGEQEKAIPLWPETWED